MAFLMLSDSTTAPDTSESIIFRKIIKDHTVQLVVTGTPTAVVTNLQGSVDGDNWAELSSYSMTSGELSDGVAMYHVIDKPVRFIRLQLDTLTGGTSPTVTAFYEAFEKRN